MEFMKSLAIAVPKSHVERLKAIDRFDYSKVRRKVQEHLDGVTARYVDEGIENLKRYSKESVRCITPMQRRTRDG